MILHEQTFATQAEAQAFMEGVEFVNDSALSIQGLPQERDGLWVVTIEDRDSNEEPTT